MLGCGDGCSLCCIFSNVGYYLKIGILIGCGFLVLLCIYIIDFGVEDELVGLGVIVGDFDMCVVDKVLNCLVLNEVVVEYWQVKVVDWWIIFFCMMVDYVDVVVEVFCMVGVMVEMILGEMLLQMCVDFIVWFDWGEVQVLMNCMVLIEGFDSQFVGCIGILCFMLYKGIFIQVIGCGLWWVDFVCFFGIVKIDCVVFDFVGVVFWYGLFEQGIIFDEDDFEFGQVFWKLCLICEVELLFGVLVCDFCGYVFMWE